MFGLSNVLVIEDSPSSVVLLASALTQTFPGARLTLAGSLKEFRDRLDGLGRLELAVIDLGLPDGSGLDVISVLRARFPQCLVLIYTLFDDDGHLFDALKRGADGYLLKMDPPQRLAAALRSIVAGEPPLSPKIAQRLLNEFREPVWPRPAATHVPGRPATGAAKTGSRRAWVTTARPGDHRAAPRCSLAPRELETLKLVASGLRLPDLARHLGVTRSTAATYLKRIYRKLEVNSRAEAALHAARLGLVTVGRREGD